MVKGKEGGLRAPPLRKFLESMPSTLAINVTKVLFHIRIVFASLQVLISNIYFSRAIFVHNRGVASHLRKPGML